MRFKDIANQIKAFILIILTILLVGSCSSKKALIDRGKVSYDLTYKQINGSLHYAQSSNFNQEMKIRDNNFNITSNNKNNITIEANGIENENNKFLITLDSLEMIIKTPQGEIIPEMNHLFGKSFNLIVSKKGKEIDYSEAKDLTYTFGTGEERNISTEFQTFFPDFPISSLAINDTWTSFDTITDNSKDGVLQIVSINKNTLKGLENYNGYECLKFITRSKGSLSGSGKTQGIETTTTGKTSGIITWYFAYKEGILISIVAEGSATSTTILKGEQELEIPSTRRYTTKTELLK